MPRQRQSPEPEPADPARLIPPAEFARLLGHTDTTTLSASIKNPPPGFPEPDEWDELPTRRRPKWRFDRAKAYATSTRPDPERRRQARRRGGAPNIAPRPDRDPRRRRGAPNGSPPPKPAAGPR